MIEFLKAIFGEKSLTYDELCAAIKEDENINIINFKKEEWVSKEEYERAILERDTLKGQLNDANKEIKSYKDLDIEGIKKAASDWEEKYKTETKELQDKLSKQEYEFKAKEYLSNFKFSSERIKESITNDFLKQEFKLDGSKFLGADDWIGELKKTEPGSFVIEKEEEDDEEDNPIIITKKIKNDGKKKISLSELMKKANLKN